jgi:hypothetical protein
MKLVKSLLLGTAAGLATVAGAHAADLPVRKAAPVEFVRVCSTYGAGFFYVPGTDSCLKIGGHAMAEFQYGEPITRADNVTGIRVRARLNFDHRTATAYGLLRTFVELEANNAGANPILATSTGVSLRRAFIQFGGLTAGRTDSFFSNPSLPTTHFGTLRFDDAPKVNLFAYTFSFGNGFSASLSVEDPASRRFAPALAGSTADFVFAGTRVPDVVANIKYEGTWGTAQLSGAVHQLNSLNLITGLGGVGEFADTEYGFAVAGHVGVNLPMIAPGDALWVSATYANGALAYLSGGNAPANLDPFTRVGPNLFLADAYIGADGDVERGEGWAVAGGFRHFWAANLQSSIFGSYLTTEYGADAPFTDFREWRIGAQTVWTPVAGLNLGLEVIYANAELRGLIPVGVEDEDDSFEGRIRIQRDF